MSPLEQFTVNVIIMFSGHNFVLFVTDFSLAFLFLWFVILWKLDMNLWSWQYKNVWGFFERNLYYYITSLLITVNTAHALKFFPWIYTVFTVVLLSNLLGLFPHNFTFTSQILITAILSYITFIGVFLVGCEVFKFNLVKFFIPNGISNKALLIFLVFIEILSYVIRPISLAVRLFANMLAGHTLLFIVSSFVYSLAFKFNNILLLIVPLSILFAVLMLEFCIAFIQTYVFIVLSAIYLKDSFNAVH